MPRKIDLTGRKFQRLTALSRDTSRRQHWFFLCDCGNVKSQRAPCVTSGAIKSCGCANIEALRNKGTHRGTVKGAKHPLWDLWCGMIARCENPNHVGYANYGGRGIAVCQRWKDFVAFTSDVGARPAGFSLDRLDTNGNYEPGNFRWATPREQSLNTSRNVHLTLDGERATVSQWAEKLGVDQRTLNRRRALGWSEYDVLTVPVGGKRATSNS